MLVAVGSAVPPTSSIWIMCLLASCLGSPRVLLSLKRDDSAHHHFLSFPKVFSNGYQPPRVSSGTPIFINAETEFPNFGGFLAKNRRSLAARGSGWVRDSNDRESKLVYFTYLREVNNLLILYRGEIIHLLSTSRTSQWDGVKTPL